MKRLSWPKILIMIAVLLIIVFGIIFLISCQTGKCIFGGATAYRANAAGCAITGGFLSRQLPIQANTGNCSRSCGGASQCDGAYPGYTWQTGALMSKTCNWCTSQCKYGSQNLVASYYPYYSIGNTCYFGCKVECTVNGWRNNNCKVDKRKGCARDVCGQDGWASKADPRLCISPQPVCNRITRTLGSLCSIGCGASKECDAAYPGQTWTVGDSCRWCTSNCSFITQSGQYKKCSQSTCTIKGWNNSTCSTSTTATSTATSSYSTSTGR